MKKLQAINDSNIAVIDFTSLANNTGSTGASGSTKEMELNRLFRICESQIDKTVIIKDDLNVYMGFLSSVTMPGEGNLGRLDFGTLFDFETFDDSSGNIYILRNGWIEYDEGFTSYAEQGNTYKVSAVEVG